MKLDPILQLDLLKKLHDIYPNLESVQQWTNGNALVTPNMHYLREHGLIEGHASTEVGGGGDFIVAKITAKGMDFLADDGGLSAILGVVTVKLHDDTLRELISLKIQDSNLPPAEKTRLIDQLRELRGESIKHLTMKLLDADWRTGRKHFLQFKQPFPALEDDFITTANKPGIPDWRIPSTTRQRNEKFIEFGFDIHTHLRRVLEMASGVQYYAGGGQFAHGIRDVVAHFVSPR